MVVQLVSLIIVLHVVDLSDLSVDIMNYIFLRKYNKRLLVFVYRHIVMETVVQSIGFRMTHMTSQSGENWG